MQVLLTHSFADQADGGPSLPVELRVYAFCQAAAFLNLLMFKSGVLEDIDTCAA